MAIYGGATMYDNPAVTYDSSSQQYGGISDVYKITNKIVISGKPSNKAVLSIKTTNALVEGATQTYYWRIYAGMSMGLLLSLTYPVDQDGETRN